jgi:cytochrome b6-f complex iron-sulfur subunit
VTHRDCLNEVTWGAVGIAGLGSVAVTYQFFSPNVLFEPPSTFRAGNPDLYPVNSVTFLQNQLVYIVRLSEGFYAVSAVCTHLGCITEWKPDIEEIACPCHGSKFKRDGTKIEGPAPRPLPHFAITLTSDGELLVDKLQTVRPEQALKV